MKINYEILIYLIAFLNNLKIVIQNNLLDMNLKKMDI
jgi:hypothetical protein